MVLHGWIFVKSEIEQYTSNQSIQSNKGQSMGFLTGKRALIVGVASPRSIAWGIAEAMHEQGAELAFTYQTEKLKSRVEKIAVQCNSQIVLPCDVASDSEIEQVFTDLASHWDGYDILIHAVGFAPRDQLEGDYMDVITREGFQIAHDISSYSFAALAKAGLDMMAGRNAALLTLTYMGSTRSMPSYNVMGLAKASLEANIRYMAQSLGPKGIRVNGISAGPVKTLAAAGISQFRQMLHHVEDTAPLRRTISAREVGNVAAFLCSDLASGVTGEITFVDSGYNILGMAELSGD
jgi:enoyl-[acyl-carrier protein] reductase I